MIHIQHGTPSERKRLREEQRLRVNLLNESMPIVSKDDDESDSD